MIARGAIDSAAMKGDQQRELMVPVFNPLYDAWYRRGLRSVRRFNIGLPIIVHRTPDRHRNYYSYSSITIDIPALSLSGIFDDTVIDKLMAASCDKRLLALATGETYVACNICYGTRWRNTMRKGDHAPMRSLCIECGNEIKVFRLLHAPGHA